MLLCHRFFWPDTPPYASMLRQLGEHFAAQDHEVHVFSSQPSYKADVQIDHQPAREIRNGLHIRRAGLLNESSKKFAVRALNSIWFSLRFAGHIILSRKYDLIMTSTFPPVLLAMLGAIAAKVRGARFVYHCMDLHPEVSEISGGIKSGPALKILRAADNLTCRIASAVVVLSDDMKNTLVSRGLNGDNIVVINNFELPEFGQIPELPVDFKKPDNKFRVVFAGNIGRFQGLEDLIAAAKLLKDNDSVEFVLMGDGVARDSLISQAGELIDKSVFFYGHQDLSIARQVIADADLGVVSLSKDIYKVAYPSKTMTYLCSGCPALVVVEPQSNLASDIVRKNFGISAEPGNPRSIADAITDFMHQSNPSDLKTAADAEFGWPAISEKWDDLISELHDGKEVA